MAWYKIESKTPEKAEIWIYDVIGEDWWTGGGVTAKNFQKELSAIKASQIDLHIDSPGGSVQDGSTIYTLLKQHPATITTFIDGWAASVASVIALAGDKVVMAENGFFMIHEPFGGPSQITAKEHRSFADILEKVGNKMRSVYLSKTGKTEGEIQAMMEAGGSNIGTWMTADEALEAGFIDEISGAMDMAACAKFVPVMAKMGFKNVPEISASKEKPTARDLERALRDAGCGSKLAKTILAKGYPEDLRDVDPGPEAQVVADVHRDVEPPPTAKKDRIADLLTRAEIVAPST